MKISLLQSHSRSIREGEKAYKRIELLSSWVGLQQSKEMLWWQLQVVDQEANVKQEGSKVKIVVFLKLPMCNWLVVKIVYHYGSHVTGCSFVDGGCMVKILPLRIQLWHIPKHGACQSIKFGRSLNLFLGVPPFVHILNTIQLNSETLCITLYLHHPLKVHPLVFSFFSLLFSFWLCFQYHNLCL